jgi:hypothetical protein
MPASAYIEPELPRVARADSRTDIRPASDAAGFETRTDAAARQPDAATPPSYIDPAPEPQGGARSRGFWWWLFGTDSITRSNREVDLKWERMHKRMQEARERRREQA